MILKSTVQLVGLKIEILLAIFVANEVYKEEGYELVVTSVTDGIHSPSSLHYVGYAVDLRTHNVHADKIPVIWNRIRQRLTSEYDVVLEDTHIHIEYQPKRIK